MGLSELSDLLQGLAGLMPGCPIQWYRVYTAHECLARGLIKLDPDCALVAELRTGKGCLVPIHIRVLCELAVAFSTGTLSLVTSTNCNLILSFQLLSF